MISLGPRLLFAFPPSTSSRAENQQQPRSQGNHLSAPCGIITSEREARSEFLLIYTIKSEYERPARRPAGRPAVVTLLGGLYLWNRKPD